MRGVHEQPVLIHGGLQRKLIERATPDQSISDAHVSRAAAKRIGPLGVDRIRAHNRECPVRVLEQREGIEESVVALPRDQVGHSK